MRSSCPTLAVVLLGCLLFPTSLAYGDLVGITELAPMNVPRGLFGAAMGIDGRVYALGGGGGVYPPGVLSDVERLSRDT